MSIAPGKYLFPFRTQKSSPVAAIILLCGKLARCQIIEKDPQKGSFSAKIICMEHEQNAVGAHKVMLGFFAVFIAGVAIALIIFVARRVGEMQDVCAAGPVDESNVCGEVTGATGGQ